MKIRSIYLLLIVCLLDGACQLTNRSDPFREFRKKYRYLDKYDWHINYRIKEKAAVDVSAEARVGDTAIYVELSKGIDLQSHKVVLTSRYTKSYVVGDTTFDVSYDEVAKPKYSWKYITEKPDLIFVFGEYFYLYERTTIFTDGQRRFFEAHVDSLKLVKGHNLPALPEQE
jgi:hypothetical protein